MLQLLLFFRVHQQLFNRSLQHRSSNHNYSLHTQRVFTQGWLNSFWIAVAYAVLPFISHGKQSDECTWSRMSLPSQNLYNCKHCHNCRLQRVSACLLLNSPFFILMLLLLAYFFIPFSILKLLLYFCLSFSYVNKFIIFVFGAFVYNFKNTISIFVIIL